MTKTIVTVAFVLFGIIGFNTLANAETTTATQNLSITEGVGAGTIGGAALGGAGGATGMIGAGATMTGTTGAMGGAMAGAIVAAPVGAALGAGAAVGYAIEKKTSIGCKVISGYAHLLFKKGADCN